MPESPVLDDLTGTMRRWGLGPPGRGVKLAQGSINVVFPLAVPWPPVSFLGAEVGSWVRSPKLARQTRPAQTQLPLPVVLRASQGTVSQAHGEALLATPGLSCLLPWGTMLQLGYFLQLVNDKYLCF